MSTHLLKHFIKTFVKIRRLNKVDTGMTNETWKQVLGDMENGRLLVSKADIEHKNLPFIWRSSMINKEESSVFYQSFTPCKALPLQQNYSAFKNVLKTNNRGKGVAAFYNLSGDTMLVVPTPVDNVSFATLKNFIHNASVKQQAALWACVAKEVRRILKNSNQVWVSTHGLGVPYLHVRICKTPKYYGKSKLAKPIINQTQIERRN